MQEKVNSWYEFSANRKFPLENKPYIPFEWDLCVLGGGTTGLMAAITHAQANKKVILLEQNYVGWGASGRNGGQFIAGFSCSLDKMIQLVGFQAAKELFGMSVKAMDLLKNLVQEHQIDCDYHEGYLHAADKKSHRKHFEEMIRRYDEFGYPAEYKIIEKKDVEKYIHTPLYYALLSDNRSGHVHPFNLTLGLRDLALKLGVEIFEHTPVQEIKPSKEKVVVKTHQFQLEAKHMVVAGNAYLSHLLPKIENYIMPVGTYIGTTEPIAKEVFQNLIPGNQAVSDANFILDYYRTTPDKRMLYGGRVSYSGVNPKDIAHSIKARMVRTFPQLSSTKIQFDWGGKVAITMNRAPYFGQIGSNIFFACGYSGHGVVLSLLAGKLMSKAISGNKKAFQTFEKIPHFPFPGGRMMNRPLLILASFYYRLRDYLA